MSEIGASSPVDSNSPVEENAANAPVTETPVATPVSKSLRTVVVCVADTPHASYAFHWTLKHFLKAEDMDSLKIVLMTVQTVSRTGSNFVGDFMGGTNNTLDKAEQKLYNQSCLLLRGFRLQLLEKFPTANVEMVTSHGQPAEDIVEYAEKQRVGTVILGSRSMSKIKKVLLGSVGDYCTHHLKCPVMIIKAPKKM